MARLRVVVEIEDADDVGVYPSDLCIEEAMDDIRDELMNGNMDGVVNDPKNPRSWSWSTEVP